MQNEQREDVLQRVDCAKVLKRVPLDSGSLTISQSIAAATGVHHKAFVHELQQPRPTWHKPHRAASKERTSRAGTNCD